MQAPKQHKVFGIGLPRSGTTTLGKCFEILGYRHADFDFIALEALVNGNMEYVLERTRHFDAFEDAPWCLLFPQLALEYPDARFVLTTRRNADQWVRSALRHNVSQNAPNTIGEKASQLFIRYHRSLGVELSDPSTVYNFHNQRVMDCFAHSPNRLLTVCWETGDGWEQLCRFLDEPVPMHVAFPHENASRPLDTQMR